MPIASIRAAHSDDDVDAVLELWSAADAVPSVTDDVPSVRMAGCRRITH